MVTPVKVIRRSETFAINPFSPIPIKLDSFTTVIDHTLQGPVEVKE